MQMQFINTITLFCNNNCAKKIPRFLYLENDLIELKEAAYKYICCVYECVYI